MKRTAYLPRAKDHSCREAVATSAIAADVKVTTMIAVMMLAPAYDCVTL